MLDVAGYDFVLLYILISSVKMLMFTLVLIGQPFTGADPGVVNWMVSHLL